MLGNTPLWKGFLTGNRHRSGGGSGLCDVKLLRSVRLHLDASQTFLNGFYLLKFSRSVSMCDISPECENVKYGKTLEKSQST